MVKDADRDKAIRTGLNTLQAVSTFAGPAGAAIGVGIEIAKLVAPMFGYSGLSDTDDRGRDPIYTAEDYAAMSQFGSKAERDAVMLAYMQERHRVFEEEQPIREAEFAKKARRRAEYAPVEEKDTDRYIPMKYIAPSVNSQADKLKRMSIYGTQQRAKLQGIQQQNVSLANKQRVELQQLQNSQRTYYSALQSEALKQSAARSQVAKAEADQAAQAQLAQQRADALPSVTRRRLPATIGLDGKVVGRGRRSKK